MSSMQSTFRNFIFLLTFTILFPALLTAQNVGVGTTSPSEQLEVAGIVYTNSGGVKFPDNTIQTTAATNQTSSSAATNRFLGILVISGLKGPLDTTLTFPSGNQAFNNVFPIYEAEISGSKPVPNSASTVDQIELTTDVGIGSVVIQQTYFTGVQRDFTLFFTAENSPHPRAVYSVFVNNASILSFSNQILSKGGGKYAHLQSLTINVSTEIEFASYEGDELDFCWDVSMNAFCN